jgi:SAM-dependent MidA family methyltransferase
VSLSGHRLVWSRMPAEKERRVSGGGWRAPDLPPALLDVLPDGFTTEVCPAAERWWCDVARLLGSGRLVAIDYGLSADEFFAPERSAGTLRAYHRHHIIADLLANPGEQDLTAHVNFTALQRAGEAEGLQTEAFMLQAEFLTRIAARAWGESGSGVERDPARLRQFQTLTHPEHLGRPFRVLIQSRSDAGCQ